MSLTVDGVDPGHRGELALVDERVRYSWAALDPVLNRAANALHGLS
jgi:long-chain acyl-CoA synthetase